MSTDNPSLEELEQKLNNLGGGSAPPPNPLRAAVDHIRKANSRPPRKALETELADIERKIGTYRAELADCRLNIDGLEGLRTEVEQAITRARTLEAELMQSFESATRSRADVEARKAQLGL